VGDVRFTLVGFPLSLIRRVQLLVTERWLIIESGAQHHINGGNMRCHAWFPIACLFCFAATVHAADKAGQADYLAGLDALGNSQWPQAIQSFTTAVNADDEDAGYHLALGIAQLANGDAKTAISEMTRAYRLNGKDLTIRRWTAGAYRYAGDQLTAAKIDNASDWRGVQQACQEYGQGMKYEQNPKSLADKKAAFEGQIIAFAKAARGDRPEMVQAVGQRVADNVKAGKYDEALRDLKELLKKDPLNEDLLLLQSTAFVGKHRSAMARLELTHILSVKSNLSGGYALRAIAQANLGCLAKAQADWSLAEHYDPATAKAWLPVFNAAVAAAGPDLSSASPHDAWIKLRDAALAGAPFDELSALALNVAKIENAHRLRWDEEYQEQRRKLEDAVRANSNNVDALLALGVFIYRESAIPGEQLGPGGAYHAFRPGGALQRKRDLNYAMSLFDRVLAIDDKNAYALTWKAALQLEYGNWNTGQQLVQQAMAIRQDIPELLELLSRVLDSAAQTKSYQAVNLRTPKTWTQFGINYDVIWTRYPSQQDLNAAEELDNAARELWNQAAASLKSAIAARAGTPDGFYFSGLLKARDKDATALDDFKKAAEMDPHNRRNREAYIHALRDFDQPDAAAAEQEKFTLEHETTATVRLANAWNDIDRTAFKSAGAALDQAAMIDPADSRIAAYQATIFTAQNKLEEAAKWYTMALAQEEASLELDTKSIKPGAEKGYTLSIDEAGFPMLLNLRRAARFEQLKQTDARLAALEWNCAIGDRIDPSVRQANFKAEKAVLPNTFNVKAWAPKTAWNMIAWSQVLTGNCDAMEGKWDEALAHFKVVADASETPDIYDPQALAVAGKTRITWSHQDSDPSAQKQWLANAATLTRLTDKEIARIGQLAGQASGQTGSMRTYTSQQATMALEKFRSMPSIQGGYDYRNNPNYQGSFDPGPDDLPRKVH
jgi:Flp pilus assembly protein TadD